MALWRRPVLAVAGLALGSAVAAIVLSAVVFPHLSINNDEGIYRLHAETLANGRLFPPAPAGLADELRPWLAAVDDDHYVLKYNPAVPGLIGISLILSGGPELFLALVAAGTTAMMYLLAREVLGDEWDAVVAAALVALSPLVIVQSALLLPYLTTFLLFEVFCWGLLRARHASLVISGLALGTAFVIRPYDAVLFAPPLLAWFLLTRPGRRVVVAFALAAVVVASMFFVYNAVATGDLLRPSFSLLEPKDTLGFGTRRLYPTDLPHHFGWSEGVTGVVRHVGALDTWLIGGVVTFALAAVTVLRRRAGSVGPWLAATAVLLPLGYLFFWGPWNAAVLWGGTRYVGPFYFLPVLIPVTVLAARGLADLFRTQRGIGLAVVVALVALSGPTLVRAVGDNVDFNRQTESLVALVAHGGPNKLVLAAQAEPFLMHPSPVVSNSWDVSGATIFAIERAARDLDVVAAFPGRTPYRLTFDDDFMRPGARLAGRLEQLRVATGNQVELRVTVRPPLPPRPGGARLGLAVIANGARRTYPLDDAPGSGPVYREQLVVTAAGASLAGRAAATESSSAPDPAAAISVDLLEWTEPGAEPVTLGSQSLSWRSGGAGVTVLAPDGARWTAGNPSAPALEVTW